MKHASPPGRATGATVRGRPFFVALSIALSIVLASVASVAAAPTASPDPDALVAAATPGSSRLALLECASGRRRAQTTLPAPISAPVATDAQRASLYVATTAGELLRYALPSLAPQARVELGFVAHAIAVGTGADAIVLAGGDGERALSAHEPASLALLERYPIAPAGSVAAILDTGERGRFVVGFADAPALWEIAYARDAPPVLRGLVHDYRMGEAVALPGRLTPRPFAVGTATRALLRGPSGFEVMRVDANGGTGVVNLDVRREIERPELGFAPGAEDVVAWRASARRGWLVAGPDGRALLVAPPDWRPADIATNAASDAGQAVAAAHERLRALRALREGPPRAAHVALAADARCAAAFDAQGRWLRGVELGR